MARSHDCHSLSENPRLRDATEFRSSVGEVASRWQHASFRSKHRPRERSSGAYLLRSVITRRSVEKARPRLEENYGRKRNVVLVGSVERQCFGFTCRMPAGSRKTAVPKITLYLPRACARSCSPANCFARIIARSYNLYRSQCL